MEWKLKSVLGAAALILACGGGGVVATAVPGTTPGTTEETTSAPSTVRIGWAGSPDTLNPGKRPHKGG